MVVAFAGRRVQSIDGDLDAVASRVRRLLSALRPSAVVGALADGADLLVAEIALAMADGPRVEVILPTPEEVFRDASVAPSWRPRFEAVLERVRERGAVHSLGLEDGPEAYQRANIAFLDRAIELASDGERAIALVVAGEGEGETVEDLVTQARVRHVPSLRIDPSVTIADRPRAFVAMPYGKKADPQRKIEVDCDLVYTKILLPALEDAQLYYRRGDEEIDSGVVLQPVIEWLADAELVIGDLQTANFNVGWELGLRHLMRARQTLLIGPAGTIAPFDLNLVRHVHYKSDEGGVSDDAAVEAWSALAPYLRSVGEHGHNSDSPIDALMEVEQWGVVKRRSARNELWESLREQLAYARDAADGDLMLEVLEGARDLDPTVASRLRAEAGVGLVRLARYKDARRLLGEVVESDVEVLHPEAHFYYAQALYLPKDAGIGDYDAAEKVLRRLLVKRHAHPEVRALLGAIAKRRACSREGAEERKPDLQLAMESYRVDYERNLNAYYEGVNFVAVAVALYLVYGDEVAGDRARELLPAIRVAAVLAQRSSAGDYWVASTLAECALYESLLGLGDTSVSEAYRAAGALRPPRGFLNSTLFQLDFLRILGLPEEPLASARQGLLTGAGNPFAP